MGTLNDWFTSEGFAKYTVANVKLKAEDEIAVQHTCNLGADIGGGAFEDSNKTLKAIALSAGQTEPAFSSACMTIPWSARGRHRPHRHSTASNKQNRVHYVGGTEYSRKDAIPVQIEHRHHPEGGQ